ncbi:MAG: hypothetical protein LQ346_000105 [Caloplaca aetnensis]|nr:MAG: hypothetical protein LQ346_000105 [Caloplaca aetnensis]
MPTVSLTPSLKNGPSPHFQQPYHVIECLGPQNMDSSERLERNGLEAAEEASSPASSGCNRGIDGPCALGAALSHTRPREEDLPTPQQSHRKRAKRKSSPTFLAGSSSKVAKRGSCLATRDERRAAQNAAHTTKEQERRLRISKAIEALAYHFRVNGAKVEILEGVVEKLKSIVNDSETIATLIGVGVSDAEVVLENAIKWIKGMSKGSEIIANLIGVDGSDGGVVLESVVKWIRQARSKSAELEATVSQLTCRPRAMGSVSSSSTDVLCERCRRSLG